ncbi:MAG: DNA-3-methyladenine glycosylase [Candidatus Nanohaloarchaea archaeon]
MKQYSIEAPGFDLELTMTCGQTFCWHRMDGELYGSGPGKFYTFRKGEPLIVEQEEDTVFARTELSRAEIGKALGLHHDLDSIFSTFPHDERVEKAREELYGLRIVRDEFFPCLISYLCSPQMRIPRIKQMHNDIAREYGETVEVDGCELLRFPSSGELSGATEEELRDLGVGYRAPYIVRSTEMFRNGFDPGEVENMRYENAREELKKFHGVGDKVADCVALFSLGFTEAYPLDTWALKAVKKHYPELHSERYSEASKNLREHFGEHAGYAQEYLFHAARNDIIEV